LGYHSPELILLTTSDVFASDMWAIGVVCLMILTQKVWF
jgi:serine/threonine protein kinase